MLLSPDRPTLFSGSEPEARRLTSHAGLRVGAALRAHGVEVVFTLCGGHVLPILDGCVEAGIRVIDARNEQTAVMMAEGYAYATRQVGVAAITAGPGFTNAVTGMADANHAGVPLVVLAGRTPLESWGRDAIQDIDQLAIAGQVSKRARTCLAPERVEEYVADAIWHAAAPRAGTAYVEFPTDVLMAETPDEQVTPSSGAEPSGWTPGFAEPKAPVADEASVAALVEMLDGAERPVVICGSGPFWGRAEAALARFTRATGIPVTTTSAARGVLPDSDPGCLGGLVHGGVAVALADVVVVCGSRFDGNLLFGGPPLFSDQQRLVQIDVRAEAVGGNRRPELAVVGDAAAVLDAVSAAWTSAPRTDWLGQAQELAASSRASWASEARGSADGVHPGLLASITDEVAHEQGATTLVADGGDILTWAIAAFRAEQPGAILTTGTALGTLGLGIPFAVGAKVARPGDAVFCLVGDGAFGLSAMELDTAARHDLPLVCVISNNGAWGDVRHEQATWFGPEREVAIELGITRYEKLAEMVGGFGAYVEQPADLRPALEEAHASGRVSVINVRTDPNVVSEILRGISQLGVM